MKKVVAKIDFSANGENYIKGDELNNLTYEQIVKLNEQGFIEGGRSSRSRGSAFRHQPRR